MTEALFQVRNEEEFMTGLLNVNVVEQGSAAGEFRDAVQPEFKDKHTPKLGIVITSHLEARMLLFSPQNRLNPQFLQYGCLQAYAPQVQFMHQFYVPRLLV